VGSVRIVRWYVMVDFVDVHGGVDRWTLCRWCVDGRCVRGVQGSVIPLVSFTIPFCDGGNFHVCWEC